jgi:hypothetical protein
MNQLGIKCILVDTVDLQKDDVKVYCFISFILKPSNYEGM